MRYIVKFTNGFWKTFDTENYTDVALHYLKTDAVYRTKEFNRPKK
jgi:hypothetical protein